jgi:hypothetical protein
VYRIGEHHGAGKSIGSGPSIADNDGGPGGTAEQQFSRKGQLIDEGTKLTDQSNPIDLNLSLGDKNDLSMKTGDGKLLAPRITSNSKIQLKFETKEFVGEYFHYTGDLFLIYPSGRLARLSCSRT